MKILFITPTYIGGKDGGGGGLGAEKVLLSLLNLSGDFELYVYSPSEVNKSYLISNKNKFFDVFARILLHSTYMYIDWIKNKKRILSLKPEVVVLSNTRLGFIARYFKKKKFSSKIIVHVDNIETDYVVSFMGNHKGIKRILLECIEKRAVKRDETNAFKYSDGILFLTERDKKRASQLYKIDKTSMFLPVCLNKSEAMLKRNEYDINIVFLGSLWYGPNNKGIIWFIENVWPQIFNKYKNVQLIIGGKRPTKDLLAFQGERNIIIFPNFESVEDIVPLNSIVVSPIFEGAGMKVKVAETLSIGLSIIATDESLVGYEEAFNDERNNIIIRVNNKEEFLIGLEKLLMEKSSFEARREEAFYLFEKYYSIKRGELTLDEMLKKIGIMID